MTTITTTATMATTITRMLMMKTTSVILGCLDAVTVVHVLLMVLGDNAILAADAVSL